MKKTMFFIILLFFTSSVYCQLMVSKLIGKNSGNSKLGYGTFAYYDFPVNDIGNRSIRLELLDFVFYPSKNPDIVSTSAYLSIKLGYKLILSETKTGFYIEPQAGYSRVITYQSNETQSKYGDGIALAFESGYSLEVGERGNTFNFGLKYESDMAGQDYTANSIGLRVSYSFHLFRRKNDD